MLGLPNNSGGIIYGKLVGEFRDELDIWIGDSKNPQSYNSRSGITMVKNLCTPMAIIHGKNDIRVHVYHARNYIEAIKKCDKEKLVEYWEVPDVGGKDHWTHGTPEFFRELDKYRRNFINSHRQTASIPSKGEMTVCGYLFTKEIFFQFSYFLNSSFTYCLGVVPIRRLNT